MNLRNNKKSREPGKPMKILRVFDSLKIVRTMFVAVACAFAFAPAYAATLPAGYTELEYIESTGTQYIDTGYFFTDIATETVTIDFMRTGTDAGSMLYGTRNAYKDNGYGIQFKDSGYTFMQYGAIDSGIGGAAPGALNTRYTLIQTGPTYSFRDASYTSTGATPTQSYPLFLMTVNNGGQASLLTPMRVYGFNIKDSNSNTKLNLIPAENSSGAVGMYDTVSGHFFTNAGTGNFIAGEYKIKIATTHYNETKFAPVETDLNAARTTINNLITQMQTNAINVSKLAVEKQTRPNADCPAGKNCLLVTDPTGAENWYVIAGAGDVETAPTTPDYFSFTTKSISAGKTLSFSLSPSGTFAIDWGDGTVQNIERTNTELTRYEHTYETDGPRTIKITGRATGYSTANYDYVFRLPWAAVSMDGSLGAIFPTLGNGAGQQPNFSGLCYNAGGNITSIPEHLFDGVYGTAIPYMFDSAFYNTKITEIPAGVAKVFGGITGAADGMFSRTFSRTQITSIPENLFRGVTGAAPSMFSGTFSGTQITSIPPHLFDGVTGAADNMFESTFNSTQITSIPENLFRGVTGAAPNMFNGTFANTQITSIPSGLFSGITGAANGTFRLTFSDCLNLTGYIPESTFAGLIQNNSPDATDFMQYIFIRSTGLATACPQNMTEVQTPYKSAYWGNAVMCRPN